MGVKEVTYYQAFCDECQEVYEDYDYTAWSDPDAAEESARESDWQHHVVRVEIIPTSDNHPLMRLQDVESRLYCPKHVRCEVCADPSAYQVDDHTLCEKHEDYFELTNEEVRSRAEAYYVRELQAKALAMGDMNRGSSFSYTSFDDLDNKTMSRLRRRAILNLEAETINGLADSLEKKS